MKTRRRRGSAARLLIITALAALVVPVPARADAVTDWNLNAMNALIVTAGQAPPVSVLHLAMVHGAVFDAVNAIDRRHKPYLVSPSAMPWDSKEAAAATAAYRVLASLLPAQQSALGSLYAASLAAIPAGATKDGGVAAGEAAAAAMLAARAGDGRFGPFRFVVGAGPGAWRPTPPAFVNDPNAWVKDVKPFVIPNPAQFSSDGPYALTSADYAREFAEVKAKGSVSSASRTADETEAVHFWGSANPIATWTRLARSLSSSQNLSLAENARLFALLYVTTADSFISVWTEKAQRSFWRPITAIREADTDGNPATEADPNWNSVIPSPPYPDHPSGLVAVSGSFGHTMRRFFGTDNLEFGTFSSGSNTTRTYKSLTQAINETIDARVNSGIHFRKADVDSATIGAKVADWVAGHAFQPVGRGRGAVTR